MWSREDAKSSRRRFVRAKVTQGTLCRSPCRSAWFCDCAGSFDWKTQASLLRSDAVWLCGYSPTFRKIAVPSSSCQWNVGKYLRNHTASHPHTLQSSATLLPAPRILQRPWISVEWVLIQGSLTVEERSYVCVCVCVCVCVYSAMLLHMLNY
jgi:hypothetical protein